MSAFCHLTDLDHGGASGDEVTADHVGSPERLIDVTSHPLPTATLHIRDPEIQSAKEEVQTFGGST